MAETAEAAMPALGGADGRRNVLAVEQKALLAPLCRDLYASAFQHGQHRRFIARVGALPEGL